MADLSIRGLSDDVYAALKEKAAANGQGLETWLREQVTTLASQPVVKARYAFKAYGPEAAFAQIKRMSPDGHVQRGAKNCNQAQFDAYEMAVNYVERNQPGDREMAHDLLSKQFETVFETVS